MLFSDLNVGDLFNVGGESILVKMETGRSNKNCFWIKGAYAGTYDGVNLDSKVTKMQGTYEKAKILTLRYLKPGQKYCLAGRPHTVWMKTDEAHKNTPNHWCSVLVGEWFKIYHGGLDVEVTLAE